MIDSKAGQCRVNRASDGPVHAEIMGRVEDEDKSWTVQALILFYL